MIRAYSERIQPQPCDLFRAEDEDEEVIMNPMEMQEEVGIRQQMLYGEQDSAKNIIVDDDEEEYAQE